VLGYLYEKTGERAKAQDYSERAGKASPDYCFPARLEEMLVLQHAIETNPEDAKAHYYLGNLLYDKQRREEAIQHWERSCQLDPDFSIPWRNLGIARHNVKGDSQGALECYDNAFRADPADARLLYELDQLRKRAGIAPAQRLSQLERHRALVERRDDLVIELVTLCNQLGESAKALELLGTRRFHPWEGGEGLVAGQYVAAHLLLGRRLLRAGKAAEALGHFREAREYPTNLGEGKHMLTPETHLDYFSAWALDDLGRGEEARQFRQKAADSRTGTTDMSFYRALALRELGREGESVRVLQELLEFASRQIRAKVTVDYFATSLPNFLLFDDDLQKRNRIECLYLQGLAMLGLGNKSEATEHLREVLTLDVNHLRAQMELADIDCSQPVRPEA